MGNAESYEASLPPYRYLEERADRQSKENASHFITTLPIDESQIVSADKRLRFLCLHGRRTSAEVMRGQTMALRSYTQIDCVFLDAPYASSGPADDMIAMIYPDSAHLEWFDPRNTNFPQMLDNALKYLICFIEKHGPFDGVMGFSQGATITTLLMSRLKTDEAHKGSLPSCVLIGGIDPSHYIPDCSMEALNVNSLHIMGQKDPAFGRSIKLCEFYAENMVTKIEHNEGHNIPSVRTKTYHLIKKWLWEVACGDEACYSYRVIERAK